MKVLITGGGGFIGSHLVDDQLKKGRKVRALDLDISGLARLKGHNNLEIIQGDIKDEALLGKAVSGVDRVFHLASVHLSIATADEEYRRVNVEATRKLLEISSKKNVARFVHCSTVGIYGKIKNPPANEQSACAPESIYDITKLEGERQALQFYRETSFPVVVVRPAWVYGPRCPRTFKLFRSIARGRFMFVGDGKSLRHCIYVADLVEALELCAEVEKAVGQIYNMADNETVSKRELVEKIATIVGGSPLRMSIPVWMIYPFCFAMEMGCKFLRKEPPISRRSLNFFTSNTSFDISKAKRELGFNPKTSLEEGLKLTYNWMLNQGGIR
jgi:nucleoside-diphosphate-sugar epimerase